MSSVVCEISAGHTEKLGRPATSSAVTQCPASDGSQAKDLPMTLDSTDIALSHSTRTEMMIVPQTENMDYLARTLVEVEGPVQTVLAPVSLRSFWVRQKQRVTGQQMVLSYLSTF